VGKTSTAEQVAAGLAGKPFLWQIPWGKIANRILRLLWKMGY
jgi:hypothetical protein